MCSACGTCSQCFSVTQLGPVVTSDPRSCPWGSSGASSQPPWDCGDLTHRPLPGALVLFWLRPSCLQLEPRPPHTLLAVSGFTRRNSTPYCLFLPMSPSLPHPTTQGASDSSAFVSCLWHKHIWHFWLAAHLQGNPVSCWLKGTPDPVLVQCASTVGP